MALGRYFLFGSMDPFRQAFGFFFSKDALNTCVSFRNLRPGYRQVSLVDLRG